MEALKRFVFNSTTNSRNERKILFEELFVALTGPDKIDLPESAFKAIGKTIYYLFPNYTDKKSNLYLVRLIDCLIRINPEQSTKALVASLEPHSVAYSSILTNRSSASVCLNGVDILNGLILSLNSHAKEKLNVDDVEFVKIVLTYSRFLSGSLFLRKKNKYLDIGYRKLKYLLKRVPEIENKFVSILKNEMQSESSKSYNFLLGGYLLKYLNQSKSAEFNQLKTSLLDSYNKLIIGTRIKLDGFVIESSNYWVRFLDRDDFKEKIIPSIQRALLRNPEFVLEVLTSLFENVSIDLSDFAKEIIPALGNQLIAKNELTQNEAANAIKFFVTQCSNTESVQYILKHLFFILNGGSGKLSSYEQKSVVLLAIGNCSFNCCVNKNDILLDLFESFGEFLKNETHEATLHFGFRQLENFLKNTKASSYSEKLLTKLREFFKKLLDNKNCSPQIKTDIYQVILSTYGKHSIVEVKKFESYLFASIEKAQSQATVNYLTNLEALAASLLLISIYENEITQENKFQTFVNSINESKKQLFTNEKFTFSLNDQGAKIYGDLFEKLASFNGIKETFNLNNFFNGFIYALLHPSYSIRKEAIVNFKRLCKSNSSTFIISLLGAIESLFESLNLINGENFKSIVSADPNAEAKKWPCPQAFCELIYSISSIENLPRSDLVPISLKSLILINSPIIKSVEPILYEKFLRGLQSVNQKHEFSILDLLNDKTYDLVSVTTNGRNLNQSQLNSIEILVKIYGKEFLDKIVEYCLELVNNTYELNSVTKEQYEIMKLPDGELYDKSLIESVLKQIQDTNQSSNVRKENKAYSYKEQLAEIELRKELEAKRANESDAKKAKDSQTYNLEQIRSKMSKKQQESLDLQINKEKTTRESMKRLDDIIKKSTQILIRSIEGNRNESKNHFSRIAVTLSSLMKSPLCGSYVSQVFESIANVIYENNKSLLSHLYSKTFLKSIIVGAFRLCQAKIPIESSWLQEPLDSTSSRLIRTIKADLEKEIYDECLDLSICSLLYPFIKHSVFQTNIKEECLKNLVDIILMLSSFRNRELDETFIYFKSANDNLDEYEEHFDSLSILTNNFPSSELFSLLIHIIEISNNRKFNINIQHQASDACKDLFQFSIRILFKKSDFAVIVHDNLQLYINSFNSEFVEIIKSLNSAIFTVRETALKCILNLLNDKNDTNNATDKSYEKLFLDSKTYKELCHYLWIVCFDSEKSNRQLGEKVWTQGKFEIDEDLCYLIVDDVVSQIENTRLASAEALAAVIKLKYPSMSWNILKILIIKYEDLTRIKEVKDQFGRVVSNEQTILESWEPRVGLANAILYLAETIPSIDDCVLELFSFFVNQGLADPNEIVKNKMLEASITALNYHGRNHIHILLPLFEKSLEDSPKLASFDSMRQNVVILMGTLAKHLDKDDAKVAPIINKLIQALKTPSQQVQEAVANCLPPLVSSIKPQVATYVNQLLNSLLSSQTYGERRGAAYGLAGILKGAGMLSLRQLNVLQRLSDAINNKNDPKQREGALLAYEMLTVMFNKVFEPYSVEILPNLLLCFGDADPNVRQAADDCAKAIMANLTFTGVKMILPKLLERLGEEESWRTKCGSVELLGAMAHCAPKQLSTCLPNIVPKLIEILSDSHIKVQKAGTQALRQIGSVIKNPEILAITNTLLEALQDPALKTQKALQVLLETKFVHFIDAPSLALIMPVVQRAFQDRSTEIRKMAAQIMGNMYSLTDQKDLLPYLPSILPGLKLSLLDPVPEVRSVSAKALGAMVRAIGENGLNEIIAWLMEKLVSEVSAVDRSGAAQGLSEVFGALGVAKLEKSMPEIIERAIQIDLSPYVRDGYIMMFIYLPLTFGDDFTQYVGLIIHPILKALADDCEFVRDTAIKAGQRIVNMYADTSISLFLPELEKGLFDTNWRIRFSSVQLLGDLLYKISGVVGKMTTESAHEDDNFGTEKGSAAIVRSLGEERRNKIFSGLYMGRSDVSLLVRQSALHIWKIIVSNTPRTLKEILPTLFNLLLGCLASSNYDKRHIASATLVDIVKKLGERILPDIIPILEYGLNSERSEQRQGVCIGLTEIMASTSRDNIMAFSDSLVPTVRRALMDSLPEVRNCAAKTFDNLHNMIGVKALDEVVLYLLDEMKKDQLKSDKESLDKAEWALDGLKQIMVVKSRALLPYIINYLTQPPVNINALCKLCSCASTDILSRHLSKILGTLVSSLASINLDENSETKAQQLLWINECELLLLSINDPDGIRTIINDLLAFASSSTEKLSSRCAALEMLTGFCSKTQADYIYHVDDLVRALIFLFIEKDENLLVKAWNCLNCVIEKLKGNNILNRLPTIRQSVRWLTQQNTQMQNQKAAYSQDKSLNEKSLFIPGFCLPKKGISCILPVFKEGLLNGSPDIKEQSAQTLCECIKLSDGESLKSSVMAITGPLIRVLGERYSWTVKSAVLDAIYFLLLKVDVTLKPFLPQLQPTFMKNLIDTNRTVRLKSGYALAKLVFMNPKIDQIILEIQNLIKNNDDLQVKETLLNALRLCLNNIGSKLAEDTKKQLLTTIKSENYIYNEEYSIRSVASGAIGSLASFINDADFDSLFNQVLDYSKYSGNNWKYLQANCMILATTLQYSPTRIINDKYERKCLSFITHCISSDRTSICMSAIRAIGFYLDHQIKNNLKIENETASMLAKCINYNSNEVKQLSVNLITFLCISNKKRFESNLLKIFTSMLINGTREKDPSVRLSSEIALVNLLQYKETDSIYKDCLELMGMMKESFQDCIKSLSKESLSQNFNANEALQTDETLIKIDY